MAFSLEDFGWENGLAAMPLHQPSRPHASRSIRPMKYPVTPDGRYFVVRGRLWRMADPSLSESDRDRFVKTLMTARREVGAARRGGDAEREAAARADVDRAKRALGERGPVWWSDGAPDFNRHMARTTLYADWLASTADPTG
jgi:hypothetical protein